MIERKLLPLWDKVILFVAYHVLGYQTGINHPGHQWGMVRATTISTAPVRIYLAGKTRTGVILLHSLVFIQMSLLPYNSLGWTHIRYCWQRHILRVLHWRSSYLVTHRSHSSPYFFTAPPLHHSATPLILSLRTYIRFSSRCQSKWNFIAAFMNIASVFIFYEI